MCCQTTIQLYTIYNSGSPQLVSLNGNYSNNPIAANHQHGGATIACLSRLSYKFARCSGIIVLPTRIGKSICRQDAQSIFCINFLGLQILGEDDLPQLDEAGNVQPLSQLNIPARPTAIAATAGGGTVKIYGGNLVRFSQVKLAMGQLKFAVLKVVGKTVCDEISILPGGVAEQSLQTILNHLEINYGTPSEADLAELMASLSQPFSSDNNFRQESAKLAIKFEKLRIFQVALNNLPTVENLSYKLYIIV